MIIDLSQLPKNDKEADERLAKNVEQYVLHKEMPLSVAENIIRQYISRIENFPRIWARFLERVNNQPLGV